MSKNVIIVIIAIVVLIGGGVSAYMIASKESSSTKQADVNGKYQNACKVFTKEAVATALGGEFGNGEDGITSYSPDGLEGTACDFDQKNDGSTAAMTAALNFTVHVDNYKDAASADSFMKDLHDPQTTDGEEAVGAPTDVSNIGDQAFFPRINAANGVYEKTEFLYVRVGKQVVTLGVTRLDGIDREAIRTGLKKLAKEL